MTRTSIEQQDRNAAPIYGAIEGGGTKFVCAVARKPNDFLARTTLPTTDPGATLDACARFFADAQLQHGPLSGLGFACFGPLELRPDAPAYGRMLTTPKESWSGVDLLGPLRGSIDCPVVLDTDVGAAALAEWRVGRGRGAGSVAYVTVGTGIGGAIAPQAPASRRLIHAEMGHLPVRRDARDLTFAGTCPFHGDCLEGLASGPAIMARWNAALSDLPDGHPGPAVIGGYLGQLAASIALMIPVERIVFGGGVMATDRLLAEIRRTAFAYLNGYLEPLNDPVLAADYICAPGLGADAGIAGALLLAMRAARDNRGADESTTKDQGEY